MKFIIRTSIVMLLLAVSVDNIHAGSMQSLPAVPNATGQVIDELSRIIGQNNDAAQSTDTSFNNIDTRYNAALERLKQQAALAGEYVKSHNYNTEYCLLIDMSLPSGKNRLFVYNIKKDSLVLASLVTHGYRSYEYNCNDVLQFSNMPYSFKTSLGKYKIGGSYYGHFGLAYKLYGLDSTNDKAYERAIVLHSHKNVPNTETYPERIMESTGCPTVSPTVLAKLDKYIKASKKPVLMWVYN